VTQAALRPVDVRWWLLAFAAGTAVVVGFWWMAHRTIYPILPDSTAYLEMARSVQHTGRFEVVPYALTESSAITQPTALWPPLFPVIIAAVSRLGIADVTAAPLINRVCFALLPALLVWALAGYASARRVCVAGMLALTAPGVLATQYFGLSEGLAALCLIVSVGCALRTDRRAMLVLSGVCGGAAYVTRNPALAICAAIPCWLVLESMREAPARVLAWGIGALLVIAPLWGYNLAVFGRVQPYAAAASTTGIMPNIHALTVSIAGEILGARGVDRRITDSGISRVIAVVLLGAALWTWRASRSRAHDGRAVRLLLLVAAAMCALLVAAATRYQFQGLHEHRFVVPFLWTLFGVGAITFPSAPSAVRRLAIGSVVLLAGARGYDSWQRAAQQAQTRDGAFAVAHDGALQRYLVGQHEPQLFVASNAAWVLRAETGTATRQLLFCPEYADQITQLTTLVVSGRPVQVIITSGVTSDHCETAWILALQQRGFVRVFTSPQSVVYRKALSLPIRQS